MTINFCEVCLAVTICSVITVIIYIASWYNDEEKEKDEGEFKTPGISNMQGLENEEPIPRGEPNKTLNFDARRNTGSYEHQTSNEIIKEKSDLCRLQDEDLRSRIAVKESGEQHIADDYVNIERQNSISEYDPVVHRDDKPGRLHLSIRYDDERSKLVVQILEAEGLIRPEQLYSPEMCLTFTLVGPYSTGNEAEKYTRVVVENAAVTWKEAIIFCITFENAIKQNLYIKASNKTDPAAPRDREISIPLNNLGSQAEEMNDWFTLEFVQSA